MKPATILISEPAERELSSLALIEKYGGPAPRYTSYPTAPHFGPQVNSGVVQGWLRETRAHTVSVYLHLPFCKSLCLYCGCNMKVTHSTEVISQYVDVLLEEMARTVALLPERLKVSTVHFGGGTPSYCPAPDLQRIFDFLNAHFEILPEAEISMEIDPRRLDDSVVDTLARVGLNRASLGIQDTNPKIQKAIARVQPHALNLRAADILRAAGIAGLNVDLLYGLPLQTEATLVQSVTDVLEIRPQRIALFGYAHVPWMKKHQLVLEQYGLPDAPARLRLFQAAQQRLLNAGYVAVGIDHFCLPEDPMAQAQETNGVHRNFMGYTTDDAPVLLGFGASAISQYGQGYAQNVVNPSDYMKAIDRGGLPVCKGIAVQPEDVLRREIIEDILCAFQVNLGDKLARHNMPAALLSGSLARLGKAMMDGLVTLGNDGHSLRVTEQGKPFARAIAACFDTYFTGRSAQHSRVA